MNIETAIYTHLSGDPALAALVGKRIDYGQLPQKQPLPAITYFRVSTVFTKHRGGSRPTHARPRFQFNLWGDSEPQVLQVRPALLNAMGTLNLAEGLRVDVALAQDERDGYEAETGRYRSILDYYIWHTEPG